MEEILHQLMSIYSLSNYLYIYKKLLYIQNGGCFEFWISEPSTAFIGGECDEVSIQYG